MTFSGFVIKEGGRYKNWKKRWMDLDGNILNYYKSANRKEKKGSLPLGTALSASMTDYKKKKNCFQVVTPERVYHFVCSTEKEVNGWIEAIKKVRPDLIGPSNGLDKIDSERTLDVGLNESTLGDSANFTDPFKDMPLKDEKNGKTVSVDDFDLLKVVGKGSFGKVMLVRQKETGKVFAMKVLNKRTIIERSEVEHTKNEKSILMKVNNPFLVGLNYSFQTPDKLYLVMDYINGGELFHHLQNEHRFPEERVRFYAAEITAGLEYLHKVGVIYRDLKPENILLTNEGHIILTDFGLSKEGLSSSEDRTNTFCGTPEYLAPEILEGMSYGKAVDWWSFGTLVYEMLTGLPPFYCEDLQLMYHKIMTAQLSIPDFVSPEASDLIHKLLERDPERRLQEPEKIKTHPFLASIDFEKLLRKEIAPTFVPKVSGESDTSNIDPIFTEEVPTLDDEDGVDEPAPTDDSSFFGFTYVPQ